MITPRERLQTALDHKQPDRTPLDLGSTLNTGITKAAYERLRRHLGITLDVEAKVICQPFQLAEIDEGILRRLHIDTRPVWGNPPDKRSCEQRSDESYVDEWGIGYKAAKQYGQVLYYDIVSHPLQHVKTIEEIENYDWPDPHDPGRTRGLRSRVERLTEETNYALVGHMGSTSIFENCWRLRGMHSFFIDLIRNRAMAQALLTAVHDVLYAEMENYLNKVGDHLDVVAVGDDIAGQDRPLISPTLYKNLIKPYHRSFFALIKGKTKAKLMLHSCGAIQSFLDDFVGLGVDIINPVQVSARGMNPKSLKRRYGDQLSFWGGIDTQHLLPRGTPQEITKEVIQTISMLGKGGGYVAGAVHNIQADVPPENILALFDTVATTEY